MQSSSIPPSPIRILIADDSAFMRAALTRMIESAPDLKVVGTATNGIEALEKVAALDPDVVTLDVEMPRLSGLGVLRRIMADNPRPVIIVSSLTREGAQATIEAFELGAFECLPKNISRGTTLSILQIRDELTQKLRAAAAHRHRLARSRSAAPVPASSPAAPVTDQQVAHVPSVIAIGTSTGGPKALQSVLCALPENFPVGLLLVQHMPPGFTGPFAQRVNSLSKITVREAESGDVIEPGVALLAPATWHMTVSPIGRQHFSVRTSREPSDTLHRPSVDVLMLSVAEVYGSQAMGVILTGMGSDGLAGMKAIYQKGGYTVGQDEASCTVYGMPRACAEAGVLRRVLPLDQVARELLRVTRMPYE